MGKLLDGVQSPYDIKNMNERQLNALCEEIRRYLIETVTETGGHLSSNLGVVELTVAMHYVFNSPYDQFVFDVGHQSYIHKILTGRKDAMKTIRQYGGISGFNKRHESEHDTFDVGHSSTSISAALGFAVARDLHKEGNAVLAVIGDGAMTAGMAFEALNNGANLKSNFIVILNDNQMSISPNVGGLAKYFDKIRTGTTYKNLKDDVHKVLDKIPLVGVGITKAVRDVRDGIKQIFIPGMFFEEMGYKYLGPIDGHDLHEVVTVLRQARKIDGPVLIHLNTVKGKGYHKAEKDPSKYHGIKPTVKANDLCHCAKDGLQIPAQSYGEIMCQQLISYKKAGDDLTAITAAMPSGTGLTPFAKRYPVAFQDVGIAEQHAVTFAAGLGLKGVKPYVAIYSSFMQRAYDQVLHDVCIQKVPVVFLMDRAGIVGEDGETHQGVFDYAFMNHLPNMTIAAPRDGKMMVRLMDFAREYARGPIAIRYPKGSAPCLGDMPDREVLHGRGSILHQGMDIALLAVGSMVETALKVRHTEGYGHITVADGVFIKPFDYNLVRQLAEEHNTLIVLEEGCRIGGYGSVITQYISDEGLDVDVRVLGIEDQFIPHGTRAELLELVGLSKERIITYIEEKVKK